MVVCGVTQYRQVTSFGFGCPFHGATNLAFQAPRPSADQVRTIRSALRQGGMYDVDASYVLPSAGGGLYFYVLWDRYVLQLQAEQAKKRRGARSETFPALESVDSFTLKTAMEAVFANTRSALGTAD